MAVNNYAVGLMLAAGIAGCAALDGDAPAVERIRSAVSYRLEGEGRYVLALERTGYCEATDGSERRYRCPLRLSYYEQWDLEDRLSPARSGKFANVPVTTLEGHFTLQHDEDGPYSWEVGSAFNYERNRAERKVARRDLVAGPRWSFDQQSLNRQVGNYLAAERRSNLRSLLVIAGLAIALVIAAALAWGRRSQQLQTRSARNNGGSTVRARSRTANHRRRRSSKPPAPNRPTPTRTHEAAVDFPVLRSEHGSWQNRMITAVAFVLLGSGLVSLAALPLAAVFGDDHWAVSYARSPVTAILFLAVYFGLLGGVLTWLWRYATRAQTLTHDALLVDGVGLHFLRGNRVVRQIEYDDLLASPTGELADITLESKSYPTGRGGRVTQYFMGLHCGNSDGSVERHLLNFHGGRLGRVYLSNRHELIAAFLRGVSLRRPELRVSPSVLSHYYIDPDTGNYDRKRRVVTEVGATVFALMVVAGIFVWVFHLRD
ncbi:hypothetical protein [Novilysobacter arseniciresistens]|nr:hypothetical protein [Lysobacter arseniciresistens]